MITKSFLGFVTDRTEKPSRITRGFPPLARSDTRTVESPPPPLTTIGRPSSSPTVTAVTPWVWPVNWTPTVLMVVKSNQAKLLARITALPWAEVPVVCTDDDRGHGR